MRVRSSQEGLQLTARLVFPDHVSPRTGEPLTAEVRGDVYRRGDEWQALECRIDRVAVERALRELRVRTSLPLTSPGHTYVDRASLVCDLNPGRAEITLDEIRFGPIVEPVRTLPGSTPQNLSRPARRRAELRLGHLRVDRQPFFPRITPWHGETPAELARAGINAVLIPNAENTELIDALRKAGIWTIAVPPAADATTSHQLLSQDERILFWYLGTRVPGYRQKEVLEWTRALRTSDPLRRPIMADVTGSERVYSRHLDLLGLSRPVLGTSLSLRDYRDTLLYQRALAQPGKFSWTWVQAEVPSAYSGRTSASKYVVEPEQLRLQTYAALASGSKAIGYWKTTPLNGARIGDEERRLMLHQLNLEIGLLEDWLATGRLVGNVRCEAGVKMHPRRSGSNAKLAWMSEQQRRRSSRKLFSNASKTVRTSQVETAVFSTDHGRLLMPIWYSKSAQLVPDEMVADDLSLVVHVYQDQRAAWLVTTTGVRSLQAYPQEGGLRIHLSTADRQTLFDQTATIVITSKDGVIRDLRSRIATIAEDSASTWIRMAELKRDRILDVESQLAHRDSLTQKTVNRSNDFITRANLAMEEGNFDTARRHAQQALRHLRRLQHSRWQTAIARLASPVSSPHTISYQTLPDHRSMMSHLNQVSASGTVPLLPAVSGADSQSLKQTGWNRFPGQSGAVVARAQFQRGSDRYQLMMAAEPANRKEPPEIVAELPLRVTSPVVDVTGGDLVRVTGRVRVPSPIIGHVNGAMIYDNLGGPATAVRWREATDGWARFELIRESQDDAPFQLTFLLSGLGQMHIADLQVEVYPGRGLHQPGHGHSFPSVRESQAGTKP